MCHFWSLYLHLCSWLLKTVWTNVFFMNSLTNEHPRGCFVRIAPAALSFECEAVSERSKHIPEHVLYLPGVL